MTAGLYNAIGAENTDELFDNGFDGLRSFNELTWLVHPSTYFDLSDSLNLEVGGTWFGVEHDSARNLLGLDVTLRHQPGTSGFYQGLVVGSEWYWNNELFGDIDEGFDPDTGETIFGTQRFQRNGGYGYAEAFLGRRYSLGVRGDYAENIAGPADAPAHALGLRDLDAVGVPAHPPAGRRDQPGSGSRRRRLSAHPAMDRVPRESQPWLCSSLGSLSRSSS